MDDQEDIREIIARNRLYDLMTNDPMEDSKEKTIEQLQKEHLERLSILHRRAGGIKW